MTGKLERGQLRKLFDLPDTLDDDNARKILSRRPVEDGFADLLQPLLRRSRRRDQWFVGLAVGGLLLLAVAALGGWQIATIQYLEQRLQGGAP